MKCIIVSIDKEEVACVIDIGHIISMELGVDCQKASCWLNAEINAAPRGLWHSECL
jgi:hypothetical protein